MTPAWSSMGVLLIRATMACSPRLVDEKVVVKTPAELVVPDD